VLKKVFMLRCRQCGWNEASTGIKSDLSHLHEIVDACKTCGKKRKFRCPNCKAI